MRPLVMVGAGPGSLPRIVAEALAAGGTPLAGYLDIGDDPGPPTTPLARMGDEGRLDDPDFLAAYDLVVAVQGRGRRASVGAGAVVVRDVPEGVTVVGNPARPLLAKRGAD